MYDIQYDLPSNVTWGVFESVNIKDTVELFDSVREGTFGRCLTRERMQK